MLGNASKPPATQTGDNDLLCVVCKNKVKYIIINALKRPSGKGRKTLRQRPEDPPAKRSQHVGFVGFRCAPTTLRLYVGETGGRHSAAALPRLVHIQRMFWRAKPALIVSLMLPRQTSARYAWNAPPGTKMHPMHDLGEKSGLVGIPQLTRRDSRHQECGHRLRASRA